MSLLTKLIEYLKQVNRDNQEYYRKLENPEKQQYVENVAVNSHNSFNKKSSRREPDMPHRAKRDIDKLALERYGADMNTLQGIQKIQIPKYTTRGVSLGGDGKQMLPSPMDNIEYLLHRKASVHSKNGHMDLAIACLRKANEIFPYSNFSWTPADYLRVVSYLEKAGLQDEATQEEKIIREKFPEVFAPIDKDTLKRNREMRDRFMAMNPKFSTIREYRLKTDVEYEKGFSVWKQKNIEKHRRDIADLMAGKRDVFRDNDLTEEETIFMRHLHTALKTNKFNPVYLQVSRYATNALLLQYITYPFGVIKLQGRKTGLSVYPKETGGLISL